MDPRDDDEDVMADAERREAHEYWAECVEALRNAEDDAAEGPPRRRDA